MSASSKEDGGSGSAISARAAPASAATRPATSTAHVADRLLHRVGRRGRRVARVADAVSPDRLRRVGRRRGPAGRAGGEPSAAGPAVSRAPDAGGAARRGADRRVVPWGVVDRRAVSYFGGQRRRLEVAFGLMHRPWLLRRTQLLTPMPVTAASALEFFDAFNMAAECAVAAGDLREARHLAERVRDFPFYRSEGHLATARLILVSMLSGDCNEAVALADCFREGWERAGRPRAGNLSCGAYAAATAHGLQGKDNARGEWLEIVDALCTPGRPLSVMHFNEFSTHYCCFTEAGPKRRCRGWLRRPRTFVLTTTACGDRGMPRSGPRRQCSPATTTPPPGSTRRGE